MLALCVGAVPHLAGCTKPDAAGHGIRIVAAENFYGSVAQEIAGDSARITSILTNPNQDPHEFTAGAETARQVADANIIIFNGLGYDEWMKKLLDVDANPNRTVICVSDLIRASAGMNPHISCDPMAMLALATKLSVILKQPNNLAKFQRQMDTIEAKMAEIKSKYSGVPVTATEPVFEYMVSALGLTNENIPFQRAVLNGTEPSFEATAEFERSLRSQRVKLLLYNTQVTSPASERMKAIAQQNGIPIVGVTETEPPNSKSYADWMLTELTAIENALNTNS